MTSAAPGAASIRRALPAEGRAARYDAVRASQPAGAPPMSDPFGEAVEVSAVRLAHRPARPPAVGTSPLTLRLDGQRATSGRAQSRPRRARRPRHPPRARGRGAWPSTTWSSASTPCCATSRSSATCATSSRASVPRRASTSSPTTTRSARSAATSAGGSTPRRSSTDTTFGFGTDNDVDTAQDYLVIKHAAFPLPLGTARSDPAFAGARGEGARCLARAGARLPPSLVNISGMSFGSLSAAGHRGDEPRRADGRVLAQHGRGRHLAAPRARRRPRVADRHRLLRVPRRATARFSLERLVDGGRRAIPRCGPSRSSCRRAPSPASAACCRASRSPRRSPPSAASRWASTAISPAGHTAFTRRRRPARSRRDDRRARPGCRSASSRRSARSGFWTELAERIETTGRSRRLRDHRRRRGRAPAPARSCSPTTSRCRSASAFSRVYRIFAERGLQDGVVWIGSGKLGLPENALLALALGCDQVNVGREAMMAVGCIQAQRCHTGSMPDRRGHAVAVACSTASIPC